MASESSLVLGWQVTPAGDPVYWLDPAAKPGHQSASDLVAIPASALGTHSVIVAQSGSGKSMFVGRLVEELLVRTRSRCVILDPNADFWKVHIVEDASLWNDARYDMRQRRGKLPHETNRRRFTALWSHVGVRILTTRLRASATIEKPYARLQVWLPSLSVEMFAEGLSPIERSEVYQCHAFVSAVAGLPESPERKTPESLIDRAERLLGQWRSDRDNFRTLLQKEVDEGTAGAASGAEQATLAATSTALGLISVGPINVAAVARRVIARTNIRRAIAALPYIGDQTAGYYFGKAREYQAAGILATSRDNTVQPERLKVIDLPSLRDKEARFLIMSALIDEEWSAARRAWQQALDKPASEDTRVPTFLLLEEAHNFVPANPSGAREGALREQIRTIASEGRKYGLFLILVSQRPDKLDPLILSECENKALLRLDSETVLAITQGVLGLEGIAPRTLARCLDFGIGRVLLIGRWAPRDGQLLYAAARRTIEGGRNLRAQHWATPPPAPPAGLTRKRSKVQRG